MSHFISLFSHRVTASAARGSSLALHALVRVAPIALLTGVTLYTAAPVHAQNLYLSSGTYNAGNNMYLNGIIYLARDSNGGQYGGNAPYVATLNVLSQGKVGSAQSFNASTVNVKGGRLDVLAMYNTGTANISSGTVGTADAWHDNLINLSGGSVGTLRSQGNSVANISGGTVTNAYGFNSGTVNFSGGTVSNATAFDHSAFQITGGTLTGDLSLYGTTATVNFVGTDLSFAYQSSGSNNAFGEYADFFTVSGTIGGVAKTVGVYIYNQQPSANSTARQVTFNGVAPVVVPEANTAALLGLALPLVAFCNRIGTVVVARRRKK